MNLRIIEQLRRIVNSDNWPMDIKEWPAEVNQDTNCLAYALGLPFPDKDREIFNGAECSIKDEIIGFFRILELDWREISSAEEAKDDEIVIQAYGYSRGIFGRTFHVIRRSNGLWTHKEGWKNAPVAINGPEQIYYLLPEEMACVFAVKKRTS